MDNKFLSPYNPLDVEDKIYKIWEESNAFNPDSVDSTESYSIVLPPPNVTGHLHLGHAYEDSLQDAFIRFHRMQGKKTLWVPGTDSAAMATQSRVEKDIRASEGKTRHDLGREELVKRICDFAKSSETTIISQVKKMGSSLDWSRYAYTMDKDRNIAVLTAFKRMYEAGLIYRANRIVNWDVKGQTTISDDEVIHEEKDGKLYTYKYSEDFPIEIATTRLETKVLNTAIAVHPNDSRYKEYVGKKYNVRFLDQDIELVVIADESVDPKFGTGAVSVTPAHSLTDWEIAERHNLDYQIGINEYGKMSVSGKLNGLKVSEAKDIILEWLKENNLLVKEEDIKQNIPTSERTGSVIEPLPKIQWWLNVNKKFKMPHSKINGIKTNQELTLKEMMKISVEGGSVDMPQKHVQKIYLHWIENLKDWCLSRQLWFGHRIPIWYKEDEVMCEFTSPGDGWKQEEDVLDTWFSSALWTFSTLGWPDETEDLKTFHPTDLMSPAYEILQLWISRMILMSGFHLGEVPFKKVLIHGLVRDKQGRKFSKSLNNGIDPLDLIEKYGADPLRMALLTGTPIGNDFKIDETKINGYKKFSNKLWNVSRFIIENTENVDFNNVTITKNDKVLLKKLNVLVKDVTSDYNNHRLYLVSEKMYHYVWHELADKIIENSKSILEEKNSNTLSRQYVLDKILKTSLKLLHPITPFITEEIWSSLGQEKLLIVSKWPSVERSGLSFSNLYSRLLLLIKFR